MVMNGHAYTATLTMKYSSLKPWNLIVFLLILLPTYGEMYDPLQLAFQRYEEAIGGSCDVQPLPDAIDWCDSPLNSLGRLPENCVCQSMYTPGVTLVCEDRKWNAVKGQHSVSIRSLELALTRANLSCPFFCEPDTTQPSRLAPNFTFCPSSITLFPERGQSEVTYEWQVPEAVDYDGNITRLVQIVGQNSSWSFASSVSPGTPHVISYLATDDDNLNWTCTFTITAETPTCSAITHLENGVLNCTDDNLRASRCEFLCDHGYQLNATYWTECQDNGTWSNMEELPQCLPIPCENNITSVLADGRLEADCGNASLEFGNVCWLTCKDNFRLRNPALEQSILGRQQDDFINASLLYDAARNASTVAIFETAEATEQLNKRKAEVADAQDVVDIRAAQLHATITEVTSLTAVISESQENLEQAQQELADALANDNSDEILVAELTNNVNALNQTLIEHLAEIESKEKEIEGIEQLLGEAQVAFAHAHEAEVNATKLADEKSALATELQIKADDLLKQLNETDTLYAAVANHSRSVDKVVPTPVLCNANGTWEVMGSPVCEDDESPVLKCIPVITWYFEPNVTSGEVTWIEPEVDDNGGNVHVEKISGPDSGDILSTGSYEVVYKATDETGNTSPYCTVTINIQAHLCPDINDVIKDNNVTYTCDSFGVGGMCQLSCVNNYVLSGPDTVTCEWDPTSGTAAWNWDNTTCLVEVCPFPTAPTNGNVECEFTEMSENTTDVTSGNETEEGVTCTFSCDVGYMLPYRTPNTFTCNIEGIWSSDMFPKACIETGEEHISKYHFYLMYTNSSCDTSEQDAFLELWSSVLTSDMTSYPACMSGYTCHLGDMLSGCESYTGRVLVEFSIFIGCEQVLATGLPWEATCSLTNDVTESLMTSLKTTVDVDGLLGDIVLPDDWLTHNSTEVPGCLEGSVLIGSFCSMCEAGSFYSSAHDECLLCGVGSCSPNAGRTFCTTCMGRTTLGPGSTSSDHCLESCPAGYFSANGLQPCLPCVTGSYQHEEATSTCITCNPDTWTLGEGSTSASDCIDYDIYFDTDLPDVELTSLSDDVTMVMWVKSYYVPMVTVGLFSGTGEHVFLFEATTKPSIIVGWDNEPIDVSLEAGDWTMFGVTWSAGSRDVNVYIDGEHVKSVSLSTLGDEPETLRMSVGNTTYISGLSVANTSVTSDNMAQLYAECGAKLPEASVGLDTLAGMRLPEAKFTATTCKASNATLEADHCGLHACQNGGVCERHVTGPGYSCACVEPWGGLFCDEELVHGGWGEWVWVGECSRTCGNGTRQRFRHCNNPVSSLYGDECNGTSTETVECFIQDCPVCGAPISVGGVTCELIDGECEVTCPPGYVLPRGQGNQNFRCGEETDFKWLPLNRLPICAESLQPDSYTMTITFSMSLAVPCDVISNVTDAFAALFETARCQTENPQCQMTVVITNCEESRRKRSSHESNFELMFKIPLVKRNTFNLPEYYATSTPSDSVKEAVAALSLLQSTARDIQTDGRTYAVTVNGVTYTILVDTITVTTSTNCAAGLVPMETVCVLCQKGTYLWNDLCASCERGSYQNGTGATSCTSCPSNQQTSIVGAWDAAECIVPPESPVPQDNTFIIIIAVVAVVMVIIFVAIFVMARRLHIGAQYRRQEDMEAEKISLYTDFPDVAYNIYYKRRQVVGFDEEGHPIVEQIRQNGDVIHKSDDVISGHEEREENEGYQSRLSTKSPLAYPEPETSEDPCTRDPCVNAWDETFVRPYEYPDIQQWDFPKIDQAVRYRVPGRCHLQNSYPLEQFGLTPEFKTHSRKTLPLPVEMPMPKHLPQLMLRVPEKMSLMQIFKAKFGIKIPKDFPEEGIDLHAKQIQAPGNQNSDEDEIPHPPVFQKRKRSVSMETDHPLPKSIQRPKSSFVHPPPSTQVDTRYVFGRHSGKPESRSNSSLVQHPSPHPFAPPLSPRQFSPPSPRSSPNMTSHPPPRPVMMPSPRITIDVGDLSNKPRPSPNMFAESPSKNIKIIKRNVLPSITNGSAFSPRSQFSEESTPRPMTSQTSTLRTPRVGVGFDVDDVMLPRPQTSFTLQKPRAALKDLSQERPKTSMTGGRRSVNIHEDFERKERPSTAASSLRPLTVASSKKSNRSFTRPMTDAHSAMETIVAPHSARPQTCPPLPQEITDTYRPFSVGHRPITPVEHPRPVMHTAVSVQRKSDYSMLHAPSTLEYGRPPQGFRFDHREHFLTPPPTLASKSPRISFMTPQNTTGTLMVATEESEDDIGEYDGNFFLTQLQDNPSTSSLRGSDTGRKKKRKAKKRSPPPIYSNTSDDRVIESASPRPSTRS
ncbi:uncharacterized protein LOC128223205 [Mya arenaria]|uniref:uncharacterized protein LOC128223205 n=1 Tax=Mya arenaria TaxID=6604 RepID=UPI0022DFEA3A|nr:uncharacterized protein LOC128223205 [Mya arenaria]